jgi:hypothetical protein
MYNSEGNSTETGFYYISPSQGSIFNSPSTSIIIKNKYPFDQAMLTAGNIITVKGSLSGVHMGSVKLAERGQTLIFIPDQIFTPGEKVFVQVNIQGANKVSLSAAMSFDFSISSGSISGAGKNLEMIRQEFSDQSVKSQSISAPAGGAGIIKLNKTTLALPSDFPSLSIYSNNPSPGQIFISNFTGTATLNNTPFLLVLNNDGTPFFYKKMPAECLDFKLQPNSQFSYYDFIKGFFCIMDSTFTVVDSITCANGYSTDVHELLLEKDGRAFLIGDDYETVDMSQIVPGGNPAAVVMGIIIQEFDKERNLIFEWKSWDHFKITDATSDIVLTAAKIDYVHTNAIELDNDGNLMISNRHLDEITKIDISTGNIIWRMGGKNNQFRFINDPVGFSHQHAIRRIPNGNVTLFDDGNLHFQVMGSRALEYKLDEINKTDELVWQYRNNPEIYSTAMGYVQRLDNGNTLIGWGLVNNPTVSEVTPSGEKIMEMSLPDQIISYRAFKFNLGNSYYSSLVPKPIYPPDGTDLLSTSIKLVWNRDKYAKSYYLEIATDSMFNNVVYHYSAILDTTVTVGSLTLGMKYY